MRGSDDLSGLRDELARVDRRLIELAAERHTLSDRIGRLKQLEELPIRDFSQEREVIERARALAEQVGLSSHLAERLMVLLIRSSLTIQEQGRLQAADRDGRRGLVIGGAGKMGSWFVRFLSSQGFLVEVADPAGPGAAPLHRADWRDTPLDHDLIVVAAPLRASASILEQLATRSPKGLVFDIGSLKSPLRAGLEKLAEAGVMVTSIHPMFGPETELLSGRHVIFVDVGVPEATSRARRLFSSTMAEQVTMDLEAHDRLIAYVLGLSHAINITFFTALAESGEEASVLARLSSTTFDAQLAVAASVANENPHLYYEIQALNDHGTHVLAMLDEAVSRLGEAVVRRDEEGFVALMQAGRAYLSGLGRS